MSFRSWLPIFTATSITLTLAWLSWALFSSYEQGHSHERENAAQYQAEASEKGADTCLTNLDDGGLASWLTCLVDKLSTDGSVKQSEYDLKAQQDMASWALAMLIVTVWLTLITSLGVLFVWFTLKETRLMATETTRIGEAQTRGYLTVDAGNSQFFMTEKIHVFDNEKLSIRFRNSGVSPIEVSFGDLVIYYDLSETHFKSENARVEIGGGSTHVVTFINDTQTVFGKQTETLEAKIKLRASSRDVFDAVYVSDFDMSIKITYYEDLTSHWSDISLLDLTRIKG